MASIQDRLHNVARYTGKDFQLILTRYFQERLLFRLSQTPHRDNFCLKGGALLYALERETSRPTLDIDLLSLKIRIDKERFDVIFREICGFQHPEDGVRFGYEKNHRRGNDGTAAICGVANQSPGFAWYDAATDES